VDLINDEGEATISMRDISRAELFRCFKTTFRENLVEMVPESIGDWTEATWLDAAEYYFRNFRLETHLPYKCIVENHKNTDCYAVPVWKQIVGEHISRTFLRFPPGQGTVMLPSNLCAEKMGSARFHEVMREFITLPLHEDCQVAFLECMDRFETIDGRKPLREHSEYEWQTLKVAILAGARMLTAKVSPFFAAKRLPTKVSLLWQKCLGDLVVSIFQIMDYADLETTSCSVVLNSLDETSIVQLLEVACQAFPNNLFVRECLTICNPEDVKTVSGRNELTNVVVIWREFRATLSPNIIVKAALKLGALLTLEAARSVLGRKKAFERLVDLLAKLPEAERFAKLKEMSANQTPSSPPSQPSISSPKPLTREERKRAYEEALELAEVETDPEQPVELVPEIMPAAEIKIAPFKYSELQVKDVIVEKAVGLHAQSILANLVGQDDAIAAEALLAKVEAELASRFSRRLFGEAIRWLSKNGLIDGSKNRFVFLKRSERKLSKEASLLYDRINSLLANQLN